MESKVQESSALKLKAQNAWALEIGAQESRAYESGDKGSQALETRALESGAPESLGAASLRTTTARRGPSARPPRPGYLGVGRVARGGWGAMASVLVL